MTMLDTRSSMYLRLPDTREEAVRAVLTRRATIGAMLKALAPLRESDVVGRAEALLKTETVKGQMFLSPSGTHVYVLRPETRKIQGRSVKMLSVKVVIPVGDVLTFEISA